MKDVLYVTHRVPWPPNRGDRIRTYNIIRYLGQRCRLHVATFADEPPVADATQQLEKYCESVAIVPVGAGRWVHAAVSFATGKTVTEGLFHSATFANVVRDLSEAIQFDAVLASSSGVARYLDIDQLREARKWVDLIDVDSEKWLDYASTSNPMMAQVYKREGQRLRSIEEQLARECDRLTVVTDAEVEVFRTFTDEGHVSAITNGVDLDFFKRPEDCSEELKCVFVGVLNYKPNSDGVTWFCENAWPDIRAKHPTARFEIVGRDPSPEVLALDKIAGVDVVGPVEDIRPHLWKASAVVTPMLISRGVQNKVLEAFAAERPLVSSAPPLVGLDIGIGTQALRAETPRQWVDAIGELFTNGNKRHAIGQAAREWVVAHHRWDVCLEEFSELLSDDDVDNPTLVAVGEEEKPA